MPFSVLIVDADRDAALALKRALGAKGIACDGTPDGEEALTAAREGDYDALVCETVLEGTLGGLELIRAVLADLPGLPLFVRTAHPRPDDAFDFARLGARGYFTKDIPAPDLAATILRELTGSGDSSPADGDLPFSQYVSRNRRTAELFSTALARVAKAPSTVLITGESGTGKELLARTIHAGSPRANGPFVAINGAALPDTLIESELFGHEKGAFTGATSRRIGRFEEADGGTFFLDEVGDLPPVVQAKLLRVLQERTIERVGSNQPIAVDTRVIAATHRDLRTLVEDGSFREDLYYRIGVIELPLPPLRDRPEDIPGLAHFFLERFRAKLGRERLILTPAAISALRAHDWPGNVRELENVMERAVVLAEGDRIDVDDLPEEFRNTAGPTRRVKSLRAARAEFEAGFIEDALRRHGGNVAETARALDLARKNLTEKISRYDIDIDAIRAEAAAATERGDSADA